MAFASSFRRILSSVSSSSNAAPFRGHEWRLTPFRLNSTAPLTTPKLFISGLSRLTTDEKLQAAFSSFGHLVEAKVIVDRASGRSKGFAFIRYASIEEAEKAREKMNATFLDGWVIFVDPAKPKEPRPPPPPPTQPETEQATVGYRTNKTIGWCG